MESSSEDSSDSDPAHLAMIRSSVVEVKDLYSESKVSGASCAQSDVTAPSNTRLSLRWPEAFDSGNNALDTTPEFRSFLAKKLVDSLYSKMKFKKVKPMEDNKMSDEISESDNGAVWGFRLLSNSDPQTPFYEHAPVVSQRKRGRPCNDSTDSDADDDEKFASVAVTAEMILAERDAIADGNPSSSTVTSATAASFTATAVSSATNVLGKDAVTCHANRDDVNSGRCDFVKSGQSSLEMPCSNGLHKGVHHKGKKRKQFKNSTGV